MKQIKNYVWANLICMFYLNNINVIIIWKVRRWKNLKIWAINSAGTNRFPGWPTKLIKVLTVLVGRCFRTGRKRHNVLSKFYICTLVMADKVLF